MEIISEEPTILLDGAHNPAGMNMLKKTLKEDFEYERLILVIGILEDKDIHSMLSAIIPHSDVVIATKSQNARACGSTALEDKIKKIGYMKELYAKDFLSDAIDHGKKIAKKQDLICITGSLFTVGEAKDHLQKC